MIIIDFNIISDLWPDEFIRLLEKEASKISEYALNVVGITNYASKIEYTLTLADNNYINKLNYKFRGKNIPTNILSFPAEDIDRSDLSTTDVFEGYIHLGDICFAYQTILAEAVIKNISFNNHFIHLLIHGILHLLGFDHNDDVKANEMETLEIEILKSFNINSPY